MKEITRKRILMGAYIFFGINTGLLLFGLFFMEKINMPTIIGNSLLIISTIIYIIGFHFRKSNNTL